MQIINLEQKLKTELNNFEDSKPYSIFIDYGQPSEVRCTFVPSENKTILIRIVHEQHKENVYQTSGNIDITYAVWADECDTPTEQHALAVFYKNERMINRDEDIVNVMTQMIQEIFDAVEQDK